MRNEEDRWNYSKSRIEKLPSYPRLNSSSSLSFSVSSLSLFSLIERYGRTGNDRSAEIKFLSPFVLHYSIAGAEIQLVRYNTLPTTTTRPNPTPHRASYISSSTQLPRADRSPRPH